MSLELVRQELSTARVELAALPGRALAVERRHHQRVGIVYTCVGINYKLHTILSMNPANDSDTFDHGPAFPAQPARLL